MARDRTEALGNQLVAWMVVEARSADDAAAMFARHPHVLLMPGNAVDVMELLPLGKAAEVAWITKWGVKEAVAAEDNSGIIGWLRELGDVPETQTIMHGSAQQLQILAAQWHAATGDPKRQAELLMDMKRLRATVSGDAGAYEEENEALRSEIQGALTISVQVPLALALPGLGSGFSGFS